MHITNKFAVLSFRIVTEDDCSDVADAAGIGGIVITSLQSAVAGYASNLLTQLISLYPETRMALVASAQSGDHTRLYRLYTQFGFVEGCVPSLRVRSV